jgi:hypothetical protein
MERMVRLAPALAAGAVLALLPAVPRADDPPPGAVLVEVVGTVTAVDRAGHVVSVDTPAGNVALSLDRSTLVYLPAGQGTVLDLVPGAHVRAGRDGKFVAYWVQIRPAAGAPASAPPPAQTPGAGPASAEGGGSGEGVAPPAGAAPSTAAAPGGPSMPGGAR